MPKKLAPAAGKIKLGVFRLGKAVAVIITVVAVFSGTAVREGIGVEVLMGGGSVGINVATETTEALTNVLVGTLTCPISVLEFDREQPNRLEQTNITLNFLKIIFVSLFCFGHRLSYRQCAPFKLLCYCSV